MHALHYLPAWGLADLVADPAQPVCTTGRRSVPPAQGACKTGQATPTQASGQHQGNTKDAFHLNAREKAMASRDK